MSVATHFSPKQHSAQQRTGADSYGWVEAAPFRAKFKDLIFQTGLAWRPLAIAIDLPSQVAKSLLFGRGGVPIGRIRWLDANRIMGVDAGQLKQLAQQPADLDELKLALVLLSAHVEPVALCTELNISEAQLRRLRSGQGWATRLTQILAIAACESRGIELDDWRQSLALSRAA